MTKRAGLAAAVGGAVGAVVWLFLLVPVADGQYADDEYAWFWTLMAVSAFLLGLALPAERRVAVLGLTIAPLLAAPWTAPRGDGDGLWVLVFPMLVIFGFALLLPAALGGWLRRLINDG